MWGKVLASDQRAGLQDAAVQRVDGSPAAVRFELPQEPPAGIPPQVALQAREMYADYMYCVRDSAAPSRLSLCSAVQFTSH